MARSWDRTHEYMHGNRTDFMIGSTWNLPTRMGLTHVYPSVLPFASNSILGSETFYSDASVAILKFYTPDCLIGIFVTILLCAAITATARSALRYNEIEKSYTLNNISNFLNACLLYYSEHLQMGPVHFPGYPLFRTFEWLHMTWLLGSFLLFSVASNDLISLLIAPLQSTSYKSVDDVAQRNVSDLVVYYMPQSKLDAWVKSGQVQFQNPFRVTTGYHFYKEANQVFDVEMRHERSIIIADLDTLELKQVEIIQKLGFPTYITLDEVEDNFKYLLTSTTMDSAAEKHFRWVYMKGFLESGLLVQDVSWYRWKMLLPVKISHAYLESANSEHSGASSADHGQHFEPLKLSGFVQFFMFLSACHVITALLFGTHYAWKRYHVRTEILKKS